MTVLPTPRRLAPPRLVRELVDMHASGQLGPGPFSVVVWHDRECRALTRGGDCTCLRNKAVVRRWKGAE